MAESRPVVAGVFQCRQQSGFKGGQRLGTRRNAVLQYRQGCPGREMPFLPRREIRQQWILAGRL